MDKKANSQKGVAMVENSSMSFNLPKEVKELVNQGIYALYPLVEPDSLGGVYVLAFNQDETFLLDKNGEVLKKGGHLRNFRISTPIRFPEVDAIGLVVNGI